MSSAWLLENPIHLPWCNPVASVVEINQSNLIVLMLVPFVICEKIRYSCQHVSISTSIVQELTVIERAQTTLWMLAWAGLLRE